MRLDIFYTDDVLYAKMQTDKEDQNKRIIILQETFARFYTFPV